MSKLKVKSEKLKVAVQSLKLRDYATVEKRRVALEKARGTSLKTIGSITMDEKVASTRNCENMIGAAQVPLGVAGPLKIKNLESRIQNLYVPLATTEGALVASVNRGCKAIAASGGAVVAVERVGTTRGPVFQTSGIKESLKLKAWLDVNFNALAKVAAATSSHLKLTKYGTRIAGKNVYVRFYFDTQDAMGMNMVTIAIESIARLVESKLKVACVSVAGNFDTDKKPSHINSISGRGRRVWAETVVPSSALTDVLKTSAQKVYDVWLAKCMIGSAMSGSMGFNAQYANVVAALFLATGQDMAHVVEGSMGITTTEIVQGKDLYISVYLPALMVGTVGGGTALSTQKEALDLLGVSGGNKGHNADMFANIVAGSVLAGELSLLASLSEGSLVKAHEKLGRGK